MNDVILVTSANGPYMPKMRPYLNDLQARLNPEIFAVVMMVDCGPPEWAGDVPRVEFIPITAAANAGTSESTSVEHGSFLNMINADDDDLIIYTNGDVRLQRPLSGWEMRQLAHFPAGAVSGVWNAGYGDTLAAEAERLTPLTDPQGLEALFPDYADVPCLNMGVFMARAGAYRSLYQGYIDRWARVQSAFLHYARQQWAVCYAAAAAGLHFIEMSPELHAQGHYGSPPGVRLGYDGAALYYGRAVAWRHKI